MSQYLQPTPIIDKLELFDKDELKIIHVPVKGDLHTAIDFLKQYDGNQATFEAYRREVERLLQWTWLVAKKSILDLKRQDIQDYIEFCLDPPISWIGTKRVPRFIERGGTRQPNSRWRPFVATVTKQEHKQGTKPDKKKYRLSQKSIREIFTVLSSFYNFLLLEEKVPANPIALIRQKSRYIQKRQTQATVKRLTETQWQFCLKTAKQLASLDPDRHERTVFIISALYLLYLRISELAANKRWVPQMKHFYQDSNKNWWFKTLGKGNKIRDIAVSDDMLNALKRYRESTNLKPLPSPSDSKPLLLKEKGKGSITSTRYIRSIVQYCFDQAVQQLRKESLTNEADALETATVNWLRHTGISDDINKRGRPVSHVRDDAGHSSSATTDRYNDIELQERHQSAKNKKLITRPPIFISKEPS
ncbi:MAG: Phage integrase family protein [Gammaproteobacteria bacterium]|jgi:site-specific recombinase XerD|nr:Phage integrase family protein [Gammaproteobacteria bacterium]